MDFSINILYYEIKTFVIVNVILTLYYTNLVKLLWAYLVPVGTGPVPVCAVLCRSVQVQTGADRIR